MVVNVGTGFAVSRAGTANARYTLLPAGSTRPCAHPPLALRHCHLLSAVKENEIGLS